MLLCAFLIIAFDLGVVVVRVYLECIVDKTLTRYLLSSFEERVEQPPTISGAKRSDSELQRISGEADEIGERG